MFRSRSWFGSGLWKPKNPHSLEHLKYLYNVLSKNQTVSENNRGLLVETLRSIAEILIWGDQNDSSVFDFFLEKNMLSFFLKIMKQKCGSYVCVQLLQTLNILFENIRNETSLYYLLSNNHVNSIIVHKFDFSDEEVMAYYISFLKTLSLKLNAHTIHFFYNEHPESMVRIAVRTLTLNVYRVEDKSMLKFIRDKTAAPYFSNLVWFIGNHILELDACVQHLDHLHYLNDILCLDIGGLNQVLTEHLLNKLLIPLYVYSLTKRRRHSQLEDAKPHVSSVVSLFLLSQVFLIITHVPLGTGSIKPGFVAPTETLEKSLESSTNTPSCSIDSTESETVQSAAVPQPEGMENASSTEGEPEGASADDEAACAADPKGANLNITDEEKEQRLALESGVAPPLPLAGSTTISQQQSLANKPFLEMIVNTLQCSENDYAALFALCLLYALGHNPGVSKDLLDGVLFLSDKSSTKNWYNTLLAERLIRIISTSCQPNCRVRLVTLELSIRLLTQLVMKNGQSYLHDAHLAAIEGAKEESTCLLRNFYKSEEIFLDMFEDEYSEMQKRPLNVEWLMMDSNILLPPTGTPMTGIEFNKRLPCGEVERARRAIRVFFLIRELSLMLAMEQEMQLPLTNPQSCVQVNNVLDLNNSDLIACTVANKEGTKIRRFLVIDVIQLILVEPDTRRLGWGVAKFVGFLQDIEVTGDKDDSRCLHITIHRPLSSGSSANRVPLLSARFIFDDHIRLTKGRIKARQKKMHMIARLLDLPSNVQPCPSPPAYTVLGPASSRLAREPGHHRPLFTAGNKVPGFATVAMRREKRMHKSRSGVISMPASSSSEVNNGTPQFPLKRPSFPSLYPSAPSTSPEPPPIAVPVTTTDSPVTVTGGERPPAPPSEETSFTQLPSETGAVEKEEKKTRRRGMVETSSSKPLALINTMDTFIKLFVSSFLCIFKEVEYNISFFSSSKNIFKGQEPVLQHNINANWTVAECVFAWLHLLN
ncbi:Protein CLEC16A [Blattella germanica]|nr:Protein CLEC16A [Blattella germanica]